jgi:E3 ubiquitin-protein ligase UHRF1
MMALTIELQHGRTSRHVSLQASAHERLLRDFACTLCKGVLSAPISMPCGHNFCKGCLDGRYADAAPPAAANGSAALAEAQPARSMRVRKVRTCPPVVALGLLTFPA